MTQSTTVSDIENRLGSILQEHKRLHGSRARPKYSPVTITTASKRAVVSVLEPLRDASISATLDLNEGEFDELWTHVYSTCRQIWGGVGGIKDSHQLTALLRAIFGGKLSPTSSQRWVEKTLPWQKLPRAEAGATSYMF